MSDLLEGYRYYLKIERNLSENTTKSYLSDVREFLSFAGIHPAEVTAADILNWLETRSRSASVGGGPLSTGSGKSHAGSEGISKRSQARMTSALRSFFAWMVMERERPDNPCDGIESPKMGHYLPEVLSEDEVEAIMSALDLTTPNGLRDRAILEVIYSCGLRVSEAAALKVPDVFLQEGFVRVTGKGNKQRIVPMGEIAADIVAKYLAIRPEAAAKDNDILFLSRLHKRMSRVAIFNIVKAAAQSAGISKEISPHTFRHSFATHLIENGADLRSVQDMLGHENILTTEIYTHIDSKTWQKNIMDYHPDK